MTRVVVAGDLAPDEGHAQATLRRFLQPALGAALLALAFALIGLLTSMLRAVDTSVYRPDDAWLVALVLLASLPIAFVHRWPLAVLAAVMAAVVAEALARLRGAWASASGRPGRRCSSRRPSAAPGSCVLSGLIAAGGLVALLRRRRGGPRVDGDGRELGGVLVHVDHRGDRARVPRRRGARREPGGAVRRRPRGACPGGGRQRARPPGARAARQRRARAQRDRPARGRCAAGAR